MSDTPTTQQLLATAQQAYNSLNLEAALQSYQSAAETSPTNYDAWLGQARTLTRMRRQQGAQTAAERCLEIDPGRFEAYATLGVLRFLIDDLQGALAYLLQAAEIAPDDPEPLVTLAQVHADLADYPAAEEDLTRAAALIEALADGPLDSSPSEEGPSDAGAPGSVTARTQMESMLWHARTYLYLAQNKTNEATEAAQEVIAREEANPYAACLAYSNIGILEARARHYEQAVDYLQRAFDMNPFFYRAGNALGRLLIVRKRYQEAAKVLAQVIEVLPKDDAGTRYAYALALGHSKQRFEALEQYRRSVALGLKGLELLSARWNIIWLSVVGRYVVIGVAMAAIMIWLLRSQPSPETLTFGGILLIILVLQRTVGRRR